MKSRTGSGIACTGAGGGVGLRVAHAPVGERAAFAVDHAADGCAPDDIASRADPDSSAVSGNTARYGGWIYLVRDDYLYTESTVTLNGSSSVTGNTATEGLGGGILNHNAAVFVCSALVAIRPNDPDDPPVTLPCT